MANNDRKSLSPMDIVAVLTSVAKAQGAELALTLAEVRREQSPELHVGSAHQH